MEETIETSQPVEAISALNVVNITPPEIDSKVREIFYQLLNEDANFLKKLSKNTFKKCRQTYHNITIDIVNIWLKTC
jgi:hypothetical protein